MTKLCPRGKAAAKRKFKVYPSAYANAYASKICAGKIKDPSGVKRKDFKGRKPAAEGGRINKMTAEKRKPESPLKKIEKLAPEKRKDRIKSGMKTRPMNPLKRRPLPIRGSLRVEKMGGGMIDRNMYSKGGSVARGCGAIMSDRKKKTRMV